MLPNHTRPWSGSRIGVHRAAAAFLAIVPSIVLFTASGRAGEAAGKESEALGLFRQTIRPLLESKCLTCHGPDKKKGGLDLSYRQNALAGGKHKAAFQPGKAGESLLIKRVADKEMPPGNPLTPEQVADFSKWVDLGAPYEKEPLVLRNRAGRDWWSLKKITHPDPPSVKAKQWIHTPIDRFILAQLESKGLSPAPEADRATLLRRVTFDLTGLPPTPEELADFQKDPAPDAYEKRVDRLLASPQYGERWARHWLDVVRFAESHGYETNTLRFNAWPYRDYVIRAFNQDIPFSRFVEEQLAADSLGSGDFLTQAATGFLVGGAHDTVGNATVEGTRQQRMDDLDDMITAVGSTFLGMTVNCARCHDHKFDPITQQDYYQLQALLAGVQHEEREIPQPDSPERRRQAEKILADLTRLDLKLDQAEPEYQPGATKKRPAVNPRRNVERFGEVEAKFVRMTIQATNDGLEPCIDEMEIFTASDPASNVALAKTGAKATASSNFPNAPIHQIHHVNDGLYGNSHSWISNEPGKGWIQIELPQKTKINRIFWGRDREEKFADRLPVTYRFEVEAEPGQWREFATSADRCPIGSPDANQCQERIMAGARDLRTRRELLRKEYDQLTKAPRIYAGAFRQPDRTHVLKRGDPMQPAEEVKPGGLSAVQPPFSMPADAPEKERRLALARWICHPDNPLAARVMVNRLWHYHFGKGLVNTPSDFGYNGARPTHPELLDWLAREFQAGGGRLKPLHKLIVLSAVYRQGGAYNSQAAAIDANNDWLWRRLPRRLEAEAVRDSLLSISGKLDLRGGGPGYDIWEKNTNYVTVFKPKDDLAADTFRRMIYQFKPRSQQDPVFGAFDCPDAALARPRRTSSTTVMQALNLFNSRFLLKQADFFAGRLKAEAESEPARQVDRAFQLALGRSPNEAELNAGVALIRDQGLAALCRALFNSNEFVYVD